MVLIGILLCLIVLYIIKLNGNVDIIRENCTTDSDAVNIKNGQKVFYKSRESIILLIAFFLTLGICLIFNFTNIGYSIIDYFAIDFYEPGKFNYGYYLVPVYILVIREIIVQVKIGDFLYKYFKVKEPELEDGALKSMVMGILYKKKPDNSDNKNEKKES